MKDAFGGTFTIWLFMFFFVIYICFFAIDLQFAKTYRVKNHVISVLEQYQYRGVANDPALLQLDPYLENVPYKTNDEVATKQCEEGGKVHHGVCIVPKGSNEKRYYKVTVYFVAELPFLDVNMTIPISGETKTYDWSVIKE